jgi:muconolactone delta-isomerase
MTTKEAESVRRMSTFIAVFHSAAFLRSRLCSIAPAQDLKYLSLMKFYLTEDESAAKIAIKSIMLHLWYITEELVIFAIFDKELADEVRENIVRKPLSTNRPLHFEARKPVFPKINPMAIDYPNQLISFIGPRSWLFFNLLKLREETGCRLQLLVGIK